MEDSKFSATLFDIALLPNTSKLHFDINGFSTVQGYVTLSFTVFAYGFPAVEMGYDPCKNGWQQLCPMAPGKVEVNSSEALGEDTITQIPSIAYDVPDIDGIIRIEVMAADGDKSRLACVDGRISNGQTVEQAAVAWSTAIVTGTFLMATILATAFSSPDSPLYGPATHKFALYSLILFTFLQTQALIGMTSIPLPPITAAWAQNFMWAVGIVKIRSLQRFFHWYITATGGSISDLLRQTSTNILVTKRDVVPSTTPMGERDFSATGWNGGMGLGGLKKRVTEDLSQYQHITVKGIERVAYKAGIERTNLFITAYSIFIVFIAVILVLFLIFRGVVAIMAKKRVMGMENRLLSFRARWREALKAIMFSIIVIAYPGILALCLWELTMKDSAAAVVLAVVMFLVLTGLMGYAVFRVLMILKKASITPFGKAGILGKARVDREKNISGVSDPTTDINTANAASDLKQFALLTMPYRTGTVYWALLLLICVFVKSALVGLAQQHLYNAPGAGTALGKGKGAAQAIGFLVVDLAFFIGFVITKPWFDKRTNAIGITVGVIGVLNAIFLVIFSDIFAGQPVSFV